MAVSNVNFEANVNWKATKAVTGYDAAVHTQGLNREISNPTNANRIYVGQVSLAASATSSIDLQSLTGPEGEAIVATKAFAVRMYVTGATVRIEPHTTNGFQWFFKGTTDGIDVPAGGFFMFGSSTSTTVSGTAKVLKLTNQSGSTAAVVYLEILLGQ